MQGPRLPRLIFPSTTIDAIDFDAHTFLLRHLISLRFVVSNFVAVKVAFGEFDIAQGL